MSFPVTQPTPVMSFAVIISLLPFLAMVSCRIYSIERPDGSYTIGRDSNSRGESADSLTALVTKASGYTIDQDYEYQNPEEATLESRNILAPHLEILQLIEAFLKFKGELGSRFNSLVTDNYDLIRSVYMTLVSKIGTLHSFTLTGVQILRKILLFASSLMSQWQISLPSVALDLNVNGNQGTGLHFDKNTNYFVRH